MSCEQKRNLRIEFVDCIGKTYIVIPCFGGVVGCNTAYHKTLQTEFAVLFKVYIGKTYVDVRPTFNTLAEKGVVVRHITEPREAEGFAGFWLTTKS